MEIVTGEQMRRIDRRAIDELGIASLALMEAAGRGVANALLADWPDLGRRRVVVVCGKGNNGGDGFVAARRLVESGVDPKLFLIGRADELRGDAAASLAAARTHGVVVHEAPLESDWAGLAELLGPDTVVVDALLGTGVRGGARGAVARMIERLNASAATLASIDLPSGLDADSWQVPGVAIVARRTYTLCRPKLPLAFLPAARHSGSFTVVPIGIPDRAVSEEKIDLEWLDATAAAELLPAREPDGHKGDYGHLLALAGSRAKSGAAVLLARGALRAGVGLVTVATPESARGLVAVQQAELMTESLAECGDGEISTLAVERVLQLAAARDALALGPGLGAGGETREAVRTIVARSTCATVVDADGLNALAPLAAGAADPAGRLVLTPHPGEAARLLGTTTAAVQSDRLAAAREIARRAGAVVILKGHRSVIARPDGRAAVNSTGNPGMATAGSGDVLTGAVGALLARGLTTWDAARLATFAHGAAGDRAAAELGEDGMIASDLVERMPAAVVALRRD